MSKPFKYKTCPTCNGARFLDPVDGSYPLCPECQGDGCLWVKNDIGKAYQKFQDKLNSKKTHPVKNFTWNNPPTKQISKEIDETFKEFASELSTALSHYSGSASTNPPPKSLSRFRKIFNRIRSKFVWFLRKIIIKTERL